MYIFGRYWGHGLCCAALLAAVSAPANGEDTTVVSNLNADGTISSMVAYLVNSDQAVSDYEVAVTWTASGNRATNAPFEVLDNTTSVFTTSVNQQTAPTADHVESGTNFQIITAGVTINSGTLVVQLSDDANGFVIADAVQIQRVLTGPDITPPTADLADPTDGGTIDPVVLSIGTGGLRRARGRRARSRPRSSAGTVATRSLRRNSVRSLS